MISSSIKSKLFTFYLNFKSSEDEFPEYWIDIELNEKDDFKQHLLSHIIRKKVKIEDMTEFLEVNSYISLIVGDGPNYLKEGKIWRELQCNQNF